MRYTSLSNLQSLIPSWAYGPSCVHYTLEGLLQEYCKGAPLSAETEFDFWIEAKNGYFEIMQPSETTDLRGKLILDDVRNPLGGYSQIVIQLFDILHSRPPALGGHSVYFHTIMTETPLTYVGVTKQHWHSRFGQHVGAARGGSPLVFHSALRRHRDKKLAHYPLINFVGYETAMQIEEEFSEFTLYPKGLNMIPGGFAGLRYLAQLGYQANSVKQRDAAIERIARLPSIAGRPNPLCAARWQSDQDYINRVICGHGDRLSVEQVRQIRLLASFGRSPQAIMEQIGSRNARQVADVLGGKYYGRVA